MIKAKEVLTKIIYKKGIRAINCVSVSCMYQPKLTNNLLKYKGESKNEKAV